jgi:dipeptidyl aminopeptidase/acylaminoacyl peptidase
MKTKFAIACLFGAILLVSCKQETTKEALTAQDYENATKHFYSHMNQFVFNTIRGSWQDNSTYVYSKKLEDGGAQFFKVDAASGEKSVAFNHSKLAQALTAVLEEDITATSLPFNTINYTDNNSITFYSKGKQYECNLDDYSVTEIPTTRNGANRYEYVAPNGKIAAYIDNYNLWVRDLKTNKRTQLTFDGFEDYGYATNNAGWIKSKGPVLKWSPNSDKIATFQQDARGVGEMYLTSTNVGHPKLEAWKHPLPGDSIVFKLERIVIHLGNNPKVVRLNMPSDYQRSTTTDHVAGRGGEFLDVRWKEDGSKVAFISSSRDHKEAHLQIADAATGKVESIYKEVVDTYYESGVNNENWEVLFDTNEFIWFSERDNWGHLYLYDLSTGKLKNQITTGNWAVQQMRHVDKEKREIIFTAGGKEEGNPYHQYLYKVNFDGSNLKLLTPDKGNHRVQFTSDYNYFVDNYSTTTNAPVWALRNSNGDKVVDLETANISKLKENGWQQPIEFSVKARDNKTDLFGLMYLPSHYNENNKYPVLNYIYPGPQSGSVGNYSFSVARRDFQAVAELGFVVVAVDAMGTPMRSKSFHDAYYGNMGDNGLPDNITAVKQLAEQYKGMDIERVGIWGHSGGGFASTRAVFAYPEFYDVAVSGAGNHDNRNYEADWAEKWQGLLVKNTIEGKEDGTTNYDNQANQLIAQNLKGKLLITHGSMDDNVPPSNTLLVVEALIKANKDFDLIIFPNKRHGYGDMTNYMTRRRWDYFVKHLKGVDPPKEFLLSN